MRRALCAISALSFVLVATPAAFGDDVNRTGQTQSHDTGKSGTASHEGENANTMGAGTSTANPPDRQPQKSPAGEAPSQGEAKTNVDPNGANARGN